MRIRRDDLVEVITGADKGERGRVIRGRNVMYVCEACGKTARLGVRYSDEGSKERFCKRCNASAGVIAPPKDRYAKK